MAKLKFGSKDIGGSAKNRAITFFFAIIVIVGSLIGYLIYKRHMASVTPVAGLVSPPRDPVHPWGG